MKRFATLFILCLFSFASAWAQTKRSDQYVTIGVQLNGMTYIGDLSSPNPELKDYIATTRPGIGFFVTKRILPKFSITTAFNYGRIYGDDNFLIWKKRWQEQKRLAKNTTLWYNNA